MFKAGQVSCSIQLPCQTVTTMSITVKYSSYSLYPMVPTSSSRSHTWNYEVDTTVPRGQIPRGAPSSETQSLSMKKIPAIVSQPSDSSPTDSFQALERIRTDFKITLESVLHKLGLLSGPSDISNLLESGNFNSILRLNSVMQILTPSIRAIPQDCEASFSRQGWGWCISQGLCASRCNS